MTTKRLLAIGVVLVTMAVLLLLLSILGIPGSSIKPVLSAPPDVRYSLTDSNPLSGTAGVTASTGISYYLDSLNDPGDSNNNFIAQRGVWCEIGDTRSAAACDTYNLLHSSFVTAPRHGDSGYALALTYTVTQTDSLASYYEHLFDGDWLTGTFLDLSIFDEFHFWVKGEGNTVGAGTQFYIRFMDKDWNMAYVPVSGVGSEWEEKVLNLATLNTLNWHQMREMTIIFENHRGGNGRIVAPLSGTLYFDDLVLVDTDDRDTSDDQFLDLLERRAFRYFWEYADPVTGLIRERATEPEVASIASVGFGLTAICAAKERGWITHEEAYTRVLNTLNTFYDDPGDPNDLVVSGAHGLFYHFVNIHDGTPIWTDVDGVSTIDTALLMAGVLSVRQCFTETEIVTRATAIYQAADWRWFLNDDPGTPNDRGKIYMCWTPEKGNVCPRESGSSKWVWAGYNEALILYLLAIASPTHPIPADSWDKWAATYVTGTYEGYTLVIHPPGPLFAHQYPQAWIDFRGKRDDYINYFDNSRSATLANRAYSQRVWYPNPPSDLWGFTASDGPISPTCTGKTYVAYGYPPDPGLNDGTIAPSAVGGSIVFTPKESISSLRYMYEHYHDRLWGLFGLKDSLNVKCEPGWFDNDYIGIDVGIMLIMIENYRTGLIWNNFMRNTEIVEAMREVGFVYTVYLPLVLK